MEDHTMWSPSQIAAQRASKRKPDYYVSLNLWPFTVVMFTLLVVFMVAPYPHHGRAVDLPRSVYATLQPSARREDTIKIFVRRDGNVFFRNTMVEPSNLPERIHDAVKDGAERKVYLAVDARSKWIDTERVIDQIRAAGITYICFLAENAR